MYRTVDTGIWTDPKIKGLSSETKLLWLYLLTNNHTHVSGLYYLPEIYISHETGLPSKTLARGLKDLSDLGVIMYDTFTETVWVKKMLRRQAGDKFEKNHLRAAVVKQLKSMLENPLLPDYLIEYQDLNLEIVSPLQGASKGLESPAVTVPVTDIEKGGVGEKTKAELLEERFNCWWESYPRKDDKKKAKTSFLGLTEVKRLECEDKTPGIVKAYKQAITPKQFIPQPTTFLNGERWNDDLEVILSRRSEPGGNGARREENAPKFVTEEDILRLEESNG